MNREGRGTMDGWLGGRIEGRMASYKMGPDGAMSFYNLGSLALP